MRAIIDGDSLVWVTAYYTQTQDLTLSLKNLDEQIEGIVKTTNASNIIGILGNRWGVRKPFREVIYPAYKATRPPKPSWFTENRTAIESHLLTKWCFLFTDAAIEADDYVAMEARKCRDREEEYTIVGTDHDLDQIEGHHYNPNKKEMYYISPEEARLNLCRQMLTGCTTDNVKGLPGIGKVRAEGILKGEIKDIDEMSQKPALVLAAYIDRLGLNKGLKEFCINTLLVLLTEENDTPGTTGGSTPKDTQEVRELGKSSE